MGVGGLPTANGHLRPLTNLSDDAQKRARQLAGLARNRAKAPGIVPRPRGPHLIKFDPTDKRWQGAKGCIDWIQTFFLIENKKPIILTEDEKLFIGELFRKDNRPTQALYGRPKKSGKTTFAAAVAGWVMFVDAGDCGEVYFLASSEQQATTLAFTKLRRAVLRNPRLKERCRVQASAIEVKETGTIARPLPCSLTVAGVNPTFVHVDELWSFVHESMGQVFYELTTSPAREHPLMFITTYAGFEQDGLLWEHCERGRKDEDPKMLYSWREGPDAYRGVPWVTQEYLDTQRKRLRRNQYLRLHENKWTSNEEAFCRPEDIQACILPGLARADERHFGERVFIGVDIAIKHDYCGLAVIAPTVHGPVLIDHALYIPSAEEPINLEDTAEAILLHWRDKYDLAEVVYDNYQFVRSAQTLTNAGLPMVEYSQGHENMVAATAALHSVLKQRTLGLYPSNEVRTHLLNARAKETPRGWRLVKADSKKTTKIDLAIALAMAVRAATKEAPMGELFCGRLNELCAVTPDGQPDLDDDIFWEAA